MKKAIAEFIVDTIGCEEDAKIYEDYSGRGMYGETTTGIVCSNPMAVTEALIEALLNTDEDEVETLNEQYNEDEDDRTSLSFDSLGHDYIVY